MATYPQRISGVWRTHDAPHPLFELPLRTIDGITVDPLTGNTKEQDEAATRSQPAVNAVGHRQSEGSCGCAACTKRRRTQDNSIRTLADLNAANRRAHGLGD